MSIALDAMGGDKAPGEIVAGAIEAAPLLSSKILLVGNPDAIGAHIKGPLPSNIEIVPASESVSMHEQATQAYRLKKDSSLMVAVKLVEDGKAEAMVSAGNTGAANAFSMLTWRRLPGIHRPAIASRIPNMHGGFVLLDAGASPDVDPEHLVEFAFMGRAYAQAVMNRPEPTVHLLNIGEEEGKGNAFAKQTFKLLRKHAWFAGNIEGKDLYLSPCDVVVCDAFVGNVVLKTSEGVAEMIAKTLRAGVPDSPWLKWMYWPVRKVTAPLREQMDYAALGGAPLLGLNHLCMICHGRSNAKAIKNALLTTQAAIDGQLVNAIRETISADV